MKFASIKHLVSDEQRTQIERGEARQKAHEESSLANRELAHARFAKKIQRISERAWKNVVAAPAPSEPKVRTGEYYQREFPTTTVTIEQPFSGQNRAARRAAK